jgi:antitoxin VapB
MTSLSRNRPPSSTQLLMRILERPELVLAVRELPAPVLGSMIDCIGLEDAGELVALASTELERLFDQDLWQAAAPGRIMSLSIKNPEAEELARELARESGVSLTRAVISALRAALLRARGRRTSTSVREAVLEVADRCAALPDLDSRPADEILGYDERGGLV